MMKTNSWKKAAAWILAAGTLLGSVAVAEAYDWAGIFIVDTSGWDTATKNHVQWWVGHGSWTAYNDMTNIANTHLYYYTQGSTWSGASYMGFAADDHNWGSWGGDNSSNYKNAPYYTKYYNGNYGLNAGSHYFFARASSANDATITPTYYSAYSSLNLSGTLGVKVKNYGASTYSAPSTSPAKVTMSGYKLTSWTAAGASSATLSAGGSTVSTTYTTVLGNTVTYEVSSIASGYNFDGWYNASGTRLSTSTSYTSDYYTSTPPAIYAHFTKYLAPVITDSGATTLKTTQATVTGTVNAGGASTTVTFDYGTNTTYGSTKSVTGSPVAAGSTAGSISAALSSLTPGETYYYRWSASNSGGTATARTGSFTTLPKAPTITSVSATSNSITFTVGANGNGDDTSYKYYLGTDSSASPSTAITAGEATTITCLPGTTYYIIAEAKAGGVTETSATTTKATKPAKPTISDVSTTANSITFTIGANGNGSATTYYYDIYTSDSGSPASKTCTPGEPVTATVTSTGAALAANTTYYIRVRGHTDAYGTATSQSAKTKAGVSEPTITEGAKTIGTTTATLPITVNMGGGATTAAITLKYGTSSGSYGSSATVSPTTLGADATAASVTGTMPSSGSLSAGTPYYYQWTVANSAGSTTATGSFATEPTAGTVTLDTPTASSLKVTGGRSNGYGMLIVMKKGEAPSWTPTDGNTSIGVTGDRAITAGTPVGTDEYIVYNGTAAAPSVTISGLDGKSQYYAKVYTYARVSSTASTYNYNTTSPGSANAWTLAAEPGTTTLTAARDATSPNSKINLSWTAATGADGFVIYRTTTATPPTVTDGAAPGGSPVKTVASGAAGTWSDTTCAEHTQYYYHIYPYAKGTDNATYNYAAVSTANAKTTTTPPGAATAVQVDGTPTTTSIKVKWTAPSGTTPRGYLVVVQPASVSTLTAPTAGTSYDADNNYSSSSSSTLGSGKVVYTNASTSVTVTGLSKGTAYKFAVYAYLGTAAQGPGYAAAATATISTIEDPPTMASSAASLSPSATVGSGSATATFTVRNDGGSLLSYTASISMTGITASISPTSKTGLAGGGSQTETVTFTKTAKAAGSYTGTITLTATGTGTNASTVATISIPVTFTLNASAAPSTFTVTADGPSLVRLTASGKASGDSGYIIVYNAGSAPGALVQGTAYSLGGAVTGGGKVIYKSTTAPSSKDFIADSGTTGYYAVYGYNGNYYSAAKSANVTMASYRDGQVENFSFTNGTAISSANWNGESGWSGGWNAWDDSSSYIAMAQPNIDSSKGLVSSAHLPQSGGNAVKFNMTADDRKVRMARGFSSAYTSGKVWFMFTVRTQYGCTNPATAGDAAGKHFGMQFMSTANDSATAFAAVGAPKGYWAKLLGIDKSLDGSKMPNGSDVAGGNYEIKDYGHSSSVAHTIYGYIDIDNDMMYANAAYSGTNFTDSAWTSSTPSTWDVSTNVTVGSVGGIALYAYGYCGETYFDEIRIAPTWSKLIGASMGNPDPPTAFSVTKDGNEMLRPTVTVPSGVEQIFVVSNANATFTAPVDGTSYALGASLGTGKVVYKGAAADFSELVVGAGTTTFLKAWSYNGENYSLTGLASTPASVGTGSYDSDLAIDTISYTNMTSPGGAWTGGQGFSGAWSSSGATVYSVKTNALTGDIAIGTEIPNYMPPAGNVLQIIATANGSQGSASRTLATTYGGANGKTMYVAFVMGYQYYGAQKWAGLNLMNGDTEKAFFGKAYSPSYFKTLGVGAGSNTGWAQKNLDPLDGTDGSHNHVYLIVGKVVWTGTTTANLFVKAYDAFSTTDILPETEPTAWDAEFLGASDFGTINGVKFNAGSGDGGGAVGCAYFDSLRIGTNWDAVIGSVAPTGIGVTSTATTNCYLGDSVQVEFWSEPVGLGQKAEFAVSYDSGSTWTTPVNAAWSNNYEGKSYWLSDPIQMTQVATGSGGTSEARTKASVTGGGTTLDTTRAPVASANQMKPYIHVNALPNPTAGTFTGGQRQITLNWTKATGSSRTWDTLIVRYPYSSSPTAPTGGVTYNEGDTIGDGTVIYRGNGTSFTDTGLSYEETTYKYYLYAENYSYYSSGVTQNGKTTAATETMPTINGDPNDWFGTPSAVYNSSVCSLNEFIWTDKPNDERSNDADHPNADLKEFRVKADKAYVYMLFKLRDITDASKVHIAVGIDTRTNSTSSAMTWLGDDSGLGIGDGYHGENANVHYPERQLAIHYVNSTDQWQVEMFADDGTKWYAPVTVPNVTTGAWKAAGSTSSDCVEICVNRADLKLNELTGTTVKNARFTVATFLNTPNTWNNDGSGTRAMSDESNHAYDSVSIVPDNTQDRDCALSAWDEDLKDGDIDFWVDIPFNKDRMSGNTKPGTPTGCTPADDTYDHASPTLRWNASSDSDGEVTGYFLEVATDAAFGATGGGSENGTVLYRVNLPADTTSYKITTSEVDYWWRVRARDTSGELSGYSVQRYHVAGKLDNEGPKASLLYVGTELSRYRTDAAYRAHQDNYSLSTSVLDSECGTDHTFGFMIQWEDPSGVYATNKARRRVGTDIDGQPWYGHDDVAYPGTQTKAGITYTMSNEGDFAYNIVSDQGRVSPNWDLIAVNTSVGESGPAPAALTIKDATGKTVSKNWTWQTNNLEGMDYPGWTIEWGFDQPFQLSETVADGNSALSITNFVTSAFQLPKYDPDIEFYLTVSAEDVCIYDEAGNDLGWEPWPPADSYGVTDGTPWYNSGKFGSWSDEYSDRTSSGFCADGPSKMRNVTTNQLIRIHVIDNDSTPPVFANGKWGTQSVTPVDGTGTMSVRPGLVVTTNTAVAGTWAEMANKLDISKDGGTSQDILYQIYDGDLYHSPLSFYFNVYDKFDESGLQYGNTETTTRSGFTMTNSSFVASGWTTNWENFVEAKSSITRAASTDAWGSRDDTVLAWQWPQVDSSIVTALWGPVDEALAGNAYGVTNFIQLDAWDADLNRAGDQAHALVAFGSVRLVDDDRTAPVISSFAPAGSGTNMVLFGKLVQWTLTDNANTNAQLSTNVAGSALSGWKDVPGGTDTSETLTFPSTGKPGAQLSGGMNKDDYAGSKYYQFDVWSTNEAYWRSQALTFTARTTAKGPTNFVVTVQQLGQHTVAKAPDADLADAATETEEWSYANGAHWNTAQNAHQLSLAAAGSSSQTALVSPDVNLTGTSSTDVKFKFSAKTFNASANQALKLQYSVNGGTSWTDLQSYTITAGADWSEKTYTVGVAAARVASVRFRLMCSTANTVGVLVKGAILTSGSNGTEEKYAEVSFEKELDDEGKEKETKDVAIVAPFDEVVTGYSGETNRFKIYPYGATDGGGNVNIKNLAVQGLVSAPRGEEITDTDLRFGNWTNTLAAVDGDISGTDKTKSGLWLTNYTSTLSGDNIAESQHPKFEFRNSAGTAVITNGYYTLLDEGLSNGRQESTTLTMNTGPFGKIPSTLFAINQDYTLAATVADFDVDRSNDWRTASATQDFTLYDNDVQEPIHATTYGGGPFGVKIGSTVVSGMGADYNHTNVLTDHVLAQQYGGGSTDVSFHLGFYDFSGWEADKIAVGGSSGTVIWQDGLNKGGTGLTFDQTNGVANSPGAEMVWKMSMATLWSKYGASIGTAAATQEVWAAIRDLDDDRVDASGNDIDSMAVKFTGGATWGKVGTFVLDDQDVKAPKWRTTNETVTTLFEIATNVPAGTPAQLTDGSRAVTSTRTVVTNPATHTYKLYDSELRGLSGGGLKLAMTADITDPTGGTTGKHNTGLKRGTTETESFTSVLSGSVTLTNTTLKLLDGATVVTNAFKNFQPYVDATSWSTTDDSTKMSVNPTRTVWGWNEISYLQAGDFLPSGVNSRALVASIEAYDADCDRLGDQMHATIAGPTINLYDNDTVPPGNIASTGANALTVNGAPVPASVTDDTLPWTNNPVSIVRFTPVTDGAKATDDKEVTGIGGYRVLTVTDGRTLASVNALSATARAALGVSQPVAAPAGVIGDPGFEHFATNITSSPWTRSASTVVKMSDSVTEGQYAIKIPKSKYIYQTIALGGADWSGTHTLKVSLDAKRLTTTTTKVRFICRFYAGAVDEDPIACYTNNSAAITADWATYSFSRAIPTSNPSNVVVYVQANGEALQLDNLVGTITGGSSSDVRVPMTFTATVQGATTNYLFAVDRDNNRPGDTLAGQAAAFYTAYDCTLPTSLGDEAAWKSRTTAKVAASSENEAVGDPTSEMYINWSNANVTMSPDTNTTHKTGSKLYSPWKSYKIYRKMYTPGANVDTPNFDDVQVSGPVSTFDGFDPLKRDELATAEGWECVTVDDNTTEYASLADAGTKFITLKNLEPGENYIFAVVGLDKAGNESKYPVYALGDTIKFIVTQGVMRAWGTVSNELNTAALGTKIFTPSNNAGLRATPALYWDARINQTTHRATRGYSLVYRDGYGFEEGTNLVTRSGKRGWGDIAGNSISNNFYAEPDGDAQKLGRGRMRFYRATYAGREFATNGVMPLASEEVYALHNVKLSEGRNFVALHGVPYTNTFRGVFGCDTTYWPAGASSGDSTQIEFYENGRTAANAGAQEVYWLGTDGKWHPENAANTDVSDEEQEANFFTRAFAIVLPKRDAGFYSADTVTVHETVGGYQTPTNVPVFDWAPVLQMPTNDATHKFSFLIHCGSNVVKTIGRITTTNLVGVDNLVAFRAPVSVHPKDLGLPLVAAGAGEGFTYNAEHPETGDRLLIWAPAVKDTRFRGDESDLGDNGGNDRPSTAMSQMYYHCTNTATGEGLWRWYDKGTAADPAVTGTPIKPNDAIIIRSFNSLSGANNPVWTWAYTPTNLYPAADRHFGW